MVSVRWPLKECSGRDHQSKLMRNESPRQATGSLHKSSAEHPENQPRHPLPRCSAPVWCQHAFHYSMTPVIKSLIGLAIFAVFIRGIAFQAMKSANDDTDLTDTQWHRLRRFLPTAKKRGRPRTALREVINAILCLVKTGAQWRLLPKNFPPWQTVYHPFRQWTRNGLLARLNHRLRAKVRQAVGKHAQPTAASLDSQTVRASAHGGEVGCDAAKKTKGRKRFLLVDTLGLLLGVSMEPSDCSERKGTRTLLATVLANHPQLLKRWMDGGFHGPASTCCPNAGGANAPSAD